MFSGRISQPGKQNSSEPGEDENSFLEQVRQYNMLFTIDVEIFNSIKNKLLLKKIFRISFV